MSPPLSVKVMTLSFSKFISESLMILSCIPMNFMVIVSFGSTSIVKFPSMSAAVFFPESLAVMKAPTIGSFVFFVNNMTLDKKGSFLPK